MNALWHRQMWNEQCHKGQMSLCEMRRDQLGQHMSVRGSASVLFQLVGGAHYHVQETYIPNILLS